MSSLLLLLLLCRNVAVTVAVVFVECCVLFDVATVTAVVCCRCRRFVAACLCLWLLLCVSVPFAVVVCLFVCVFSCVALQEDLIAIINILQVLLV